VLHPAGAFPVGRSSRPHMLEELVRGFGKRDDLPFEGSVARAYLRVLARLDGRGILWPTRMLAGRVPPWYSCQPALCPAGRRPPGYPRLAAWLWLCSRGVADELPAAPVNLSRSRQACRCHGEPDAERSAPWPSPGSQRRSGSMCVRSPGRGVRPRRGCDDGHIPGGYCGRPSAARGRACVVGPWPLATRTVRRSTRPPSILAGVGSWLGPG
jgi:hypothetical protein